MLLPNSLMKVILDINKLNAVVKPVDEKTQQFQLR